MVKNIAFLKCKTGLSREAFIDYYESKHVPLILAIAPQIVEYRRNFLIRDGAIEMPGAAPLEFDVVTELWYADRESYRAAMAAYTDPVNAARIARDEENLFDRTRTRFFEVDERHARIARRDADSSPR